VSPRKSSATAAMKSSGNNKGAKAAGPKPTLKQEIAEWIEVYYTSSAPHEITY
jgi:hypothetical protein